MAKEANNLKRKQHHAADKQGEHLYEFNLLSSILIFLL